MFYFTKNGFDDFSINTMCVIECIQSFEFMFQPKSSFAHLVFIIALAKNSGNPGELVKDFDLQNQ